MVGGRFWLSLRWWVYRDRRGGLEEFGLSDDSGLEVSGGVIVGLFGVCL